MDSITMGSTPAPLKTVILDTLFPVWCLSCSGEVYFENDYTCIACGTPRDLALSSFACPICEARMPEGKICGPCRKKTVLRRFFSAGSYAHPVLRECIHQFKYQRVKLFSWQLASFLLSTLTDNDFSVSFTDQTHGILLVPIPLAKQKLRMRSFNQAEELAKIIAARLDLPLAANALMRTRGGTSQTELNDEESRRKNVKDAFCCSDPSLIKNKIVVLVDDVYTSGATMEECGRVVKKAGAKEIWGMVIAKG